MEKSWLRFSGKALVIAVCLSAGGADAQTGGASGAYLRAPTGAQAIAMGGAGSASPAYLEAWWDPAILSTLRTRLAGLGMGVRSLGRTDGFASFDFRIPPRMGMGVALIYRGDPFLDELHTETEEKANGGAYTALIGKIGLSYFINRQWSAGVNFGIYYQSLPTGFNDDLSLQSSSTTSLGGFDFALRWEILDNWAIAALYRNLGAAMSWNISSDYDMNTMIDDKPLPELVAASRLEIKLLNKPFIWTSDIIGYIFDQDGNRLTMAEAVCHNGFEWQYFEHFCVRAGLGDVHLNSMIVDSTAEYFNTFGLRITAGLGCDLYKIQPGLKLNYAIATDKVWAGVDQMMDLAWAF